MTNAITIENQKPGTPQSVWMIQPGEASSNIEGFTTSMSANVGDTIDFKINTDSTNYRIDIYRLGYYGGDGATLVSSIQHTSTTAVDQPTPMYDPSTGLVDAGNWSVTDNWIVPADATSGVYIADLVREDGTPGKNMIAFVVTNNGNGSDILFQTSDQTWEAYNSWGTGSLYDGGQTQAVSYNRPMATPVGPGASTAAGSWDYIYGEEFPAIYWLEQNGYDVSYQSSIDTSSNANSLLSHKVFLSVGHDEYWTADQRANVVAARDAGVNLNFWSGNEIYWKTELQPSIDGSGTPNRTLVTYKTSSTGLANPDGIWTGTWEDPAGADSGGYRPANGLTGTLYGVDWDHTTPLHALTVPYGDSQLRFWRNTDVADLQPGETYTSMGDYIGYEWDVVPDNGFQPAGTITLSSTPVTTSAVMDLVTGTNELGTGTATHSLSLYRAPSGALVFGAGTIMWTWALSSNHTAFDQGLGADMPADPAIQQAMVNLLADQGVQPETLQASLKLAQQSTDFTAPIATITTNTAVEFQAGQSSTIAGSALDLGGGVVAGVEVSTDGGNSWHAAFVTQDAASTSWAYSWTPNQTGPYTILARAIDDSVNLEQPKLSSDFAITDFFGNFSVAQGWSNADTARLMTDVNGDGRADLVGFGDSSVFATLGMGTDAQYLGGASLANSLNVVTNDYGISQGYSQQNQRGVDFVGNFASDSTSHVASIWGVGEEGFYYSVATDSSDGGLAYQLHSYGNFGLAQGWSPTYSIDVTFLSASDSYASIVGFGDAGLWVGPEAFAPTATASQAYIAAGSESLGGAAGWDDMLDIQTVRDYKDNTIDINGDGIADFVGMGPNGLEYAFGQYATDATGSHIYSLGTIHTGDPTSAVDFGSDQGWDNTTSERIIADINGDGRVDVVGFGDVGMWVSLGQTPNVDGSGAFGPAYLAMDDYGTSQGWSTAENTRVLGDVYGTGQLQVIGFGSDYTFIATPTTAPVTGHVTFGITDSFHAYGSNEGYLPGQNFRGVADVTGTGVDSIIVSSAMNTQIISHV